LPAIYGEVLVPQAVMDELQDSDAPSEVRNWLSAPPQWLRISSMTFQVDPLLDRLDRGERDAILLAESIRADRLIMDDLDGRLEAANRKLAVIGTLGILAEAARRGRIARSRLAFHTRTYRNHALSHPFRQPLPLS
jgi:predicted nucleic acid-binding protein